MNDAAAELRSRGPRAITRVLDLLKLLAGRPGGMSLAELSATLAVPKSTLIDTLRGLSELRYLSHAEGRYRLGPTTFQFAGRIVASWSAPEAVRAKVRELAAETNESVGFAVADWEIGQAVYTEAINSNQPVRYAMEAGVRAPLYASAAGRVLLAYADPDVVDGYLASTHLKPLTDATRTNAAAIRENLATIRQQGYCASFAEMLSDTAALAVPIHGFAGENLGALIIAAPLERLRLNFERLRDAIVRAGLEISAARPSNSR